MPSENTNKTAHVKKVWGDDKSERDDRDFDPNTGKPETANTTDSEDRAWQPLPNPTPG